MLGSPVVYSRLAWGDLNSPLLLLTVFLFFVFFEFFMKNLNMLVLTGILTMVFLLEDLVLFFVAMELRVIPFLYLFMTGEYPERFERVMWIVLYMFFFGLPFVYMVVRGWDESLDVAPLLMVFMGKLPLFGFHYWLPKAHRYATAVGRMVLAGLMLKVAIYGFYLVSPFHFEELIALSLVGGVLARLQVLFVTDIKTIIAVSRVAHMCYIGVMVCINSDLRVLGCNLIALGHGVRAATLFGISTSIYTYMSNRRWYK